MIKFAIKSAIAASAIYYVREQGVWKNSDEAIETAKRLKTAVNPYIQEVKAQIPVEFPEVPPTENIFQEAKQYWNLGVRATFTFLIHLPQCSKEYAKKGTDALLQNEEIRNFIGSFSAGDSPKTVAK